MDELDSLQGVKAKILSLILDENFEVIQLDENPMRLVCIRDDLPFVVKKWLVECLKAKSDLFTDSPGEMPDIDFSVAYHQFKFEPFSHYGIQ